MSSKISFFNPTLQTSQNTLNAYSNGGNPTSPVTRNSSISPTPFPVKNPTYVNAGSTTNLVVDQFNSSYWSGLDLNIFFNDVLIDDIVNIQYQITENVMPLMSWGDYTVRTMAHGFRIIQGSFSVNFKRSLYMKSVLEYLAGETSGRKGTSPLTPSALKADIALPKTLEQMLGMINNGGDNGPNLDVLDEIARANQTNFWGSAISKSPTSQFKYVPNAPMFYGGSYGFSIIFRFGDIDNGKDERITYGRNGPSASPYETGTIFSLTGVNINGVGTAVDDSGRPVMEVYSFLAKDKIDEVG